MSQIVAVYSAEPDFPASDQHPEAARYGLGGVWVDAVGGEPTQGEVDDFRNPPPDLNAYANAKYSAQMAGGVNIGGVWVSTTGNGRVDMLGAVSLAQLAPEHVFDWVNGATIIQLTAAQVIALGLAVGAWVQDNYTILGAVRADIALGNITTTAEIDAAAWPSNT